MEIDVREVARRAAHRALAERGGAEHPVAHPQRPSTAGVHVAAEPVAPAAPRRRGPELVAAESLAQVPDGGTFVVPDGALVTQLAEDEARLRGIRLLRSGSHGRLRVAIGADHGGFALKRDVLAWVAELGHATQDFGTRDERPVDYPDFARAVAEAVASGQCDLGIVLDGAGIGSAIAANKVPGVRAATCCDAAMAKNAREHNFANVLSLGARTLSRTAAHEIVRTFLATATGEERHRKRVEKIGEIERRYARGPREGTRA
jgi:ribose 5-phosphate isomerase B